MINHTIWRDDVKRQKSSLLTRLITNALPRLHEYVMVGISVPKVRALIFLALRIIF